MKKMATLLNKIEDEWSAQQKAKLKEKLKEKMEMAKKQSQYVTKLLGQCKSWGGPVCSIEELQWTMKKRPDAAEIIVKVELKYYKHTYRAEVIANPSLFKLIRVTYEERLSYLTVLLNVQALEVCNFQKKWSSIKEKVTIVLPNMAQFCKNHEKMTVFSKTRAGRSSAILYRMIIFM